MASLRELKPPDVEPLRRLLAREAAHNLYLAGLLDEFGLTCPPGGTPFTFWGRFEGDELTAAVFVGGEAGLVVPSHGSASTVLDFLPHLPRPPRCVLGEKSAADALVQHTGLTPALSWTQRLYLVSADDLGPFTNPLLRLATAADVPRLVPLAAACVQEATGQDALAVDEAGFAARVAQRVAARRTYVLEEDGALVFKLDVGSRSTLGAELEGIYTVPRARRRGHALLCMGQISRFLLSSLPRLAVRFSEPNEALATLLRRVGYHAGRAFRVAISRQGLEPAG